MDPILILPRLLRNTVTEAWELGVLAQNRATRGAKTTLPAAQYHNCSEIVAHEAKVKTTPIVEARF